MNISEPAGEVAPRAYHHGHLAEALLAAGVELARVGGPDAVVLREAARRAGVSATAAYRHFDGQTALQQAVKEYALEVLSEHMQAAAAQAGAAADTRPASVVRLEAIGRAYLSFALNERGLFRTFCIGLPMPEGVSLDSDQPAFGVLTQALDAMTADGLLAPEIRLTAPLAAWSAVHGLAILCLDGPLADIPDQERDNLFEATLRMVLHGLLVRP